MLLSILFYGFLSYILYRLVFFFIIPIYRTTKQVKKGFRDMEEKMREQPGAYGQQTRSGESKTTVTGKGDYIDFEEVK